MKTIIGCLGVLLCGSMAFAEAKKPLVERLLTLNTAVNYDEVYNQALDEMQNLSAGEKAKLSKALEPILLKDKSTDRRANAASALGDLCGEVKSNDAVLAKAFKDKEKVVRQAVTSGITRCGATTTATETLKQLLKDKDETVRVMAESNLERLGVKPAK